MARIRTIKPEFWTDETLAECSMSARLLFVATLNFADDNGNLERSSRQLKAQAFPYDSIDCEPLVLEMIRVGLLIEYQVAERKYLHIKGFLAHQKIDRPSKCRIPPCEDTTSTRPILDEHSTSPRPVRNLSKESKEGTGLVEDSTNGSGVSQQVAQDPEAAWQRLFESRAPRDARTQKALDAIGGFSRVKMRTAFDSAKVKNEFVAAYQAEQCA